MISTWWTVKGPSQRGSACTTLERGGRTIRQLANATGASPTRYRDHRGPSKGSERLRRAAHVGERIRALPGVVEAEVTTGVARIEIDTDAGSVEDVERVLTELDVRRRNVGGREPPADSHGAEGHDHGKAEHDHGGPFGERSELIFAVTSAAVLWTAGFLSTPSPTCLPACSQRSSSSPGCPPSARLLHASARRSRASATAASSRSTPSCSSPPPARRRWEPGRKARCCCSCSASATRSSIMRWAAAKRAIEALAELAPRDGARSAATAQSWSCPVEELVVGDTVVGQAERADSRPMASCSRARAASTRRRVTGESMPVDKQPVAMPRGRGDSPGRLRPSAVFAGTINGAGAIEIEVTRMSTDTTLAKVVTHGAAKPRPKSRRRSGSPIASNGSSCPSSSALVVVLLFAWVVVDEPFRDSFYRAMAVLVAASPCALAIATPSAVLSGVARAARARRAGQGRRSAREPRHAACHRVRQDRHPDGGPAPDHRRRARWAAREASCSRSPSPSNA